MRLFAAVAFAAACLLSTSAQAAGWKTMVFSDLGISAQLPDEPRRQEQVDPDTKTSVTYLAAKAPDGRVYVIGAADISAVLKAPEDKDNFAIGVLKGARGDRAAIEAEHTVKTRGTNGREAVYRDDRFVTRVRAFVSGGWGYTAIALAPGSDASKVHDAEADAFFETLTPTRK